MGSTADLAWTAVFTSMILSAIAGNLVVFWIVLGHKRMQNVTNYFLVNLSLADLMMSSLNTIFNFIFMKNRNWIFGSVYCTINNFIAYLSVAVSVFTLMAISIDRYIAIVRPLKPRMSKTCARVFLLVIWICSSLLSLPSLLYSQTMTFSYGNGENLTVCYLLWPDGPSNVSEQDYIYNIIYFVLTYIIPIVAMGICYGRISGVLWGKSVIRENACNDLAHERKLMSKRKVVKMFIVVVIIFAVCWLPYHVYFLYTYHHKDLAAKPFIQHVYLGFYWLAMANSMFNPFIYYWMNARFRGYFLALLSSLRLVLCEPSRLFRRTDSKSSLNIGVVPVKRRGVVKIELAHYTSNVQSKKEASRVSNAAGCGGASGANGVAGSGAGPTGVANLEHRNHAQVGGGVGGSKLHSVDSIGDGEAAGVRIGCCNSRGMDVSSNSAPEIMFCSTGAGSGGRSGKRHSSKHLYPHVLTVSTGPVPGVSGGAGGASDGSKKNGLVGTQSQDTLLRIAIPFRNNPVLMYQSKQQQ